MAFGGVPIGVPIPPRLAAIGMARARAILPFPSGGRVFRTGARKVSIIAAVAVLLMNIENMPITSRKPRRTNSDFLPNGFRRTRANWTSIPTLVAAIARMNPPRNSIITGSANVARMDL